MHRNGCICRAGTRKCPCTISLIRRRKSFLKIGTAAQGGWGQWLIRSSTTRFSTLPTSIRPGTGSSTSGQPTQKIIESRRRAKFITPIPKPKKRKAAAQTGIRLRRGQGAFDARSSSTTRPRSSTRSAATWTRGARCPIRTSGRSRRRRPACCSTGGTTSSAASARSSARSRRSRPRSG